MSLIIDNSTNTSSTR